MYSGAYCCWRVRSDDTVNPRTKKDGALAAIFCFICGFYTIYYGIKNFAENKIPLIMFVAGLVLCLVFRPDMAALSGGVAI